MSDENPHRAGFVGIIGRPNVGKSTLMNRIVGERLAIATPKPQTTRDRIRGIRTFDDWQVTFVDTPGIHEARTRLNRYMVDLATSTVREVDLVYLLIDAPKALEKPAAIVEQTERIAEHLAFAKTPTFLVLNKVDVVKDKGRLFGLIETLTPIHDFVEVVPISARKGKGVDALLSVTRPFMPEGPALFDADTLTDRPLRFIASEIIRERLFMRLNKELPYQIAVDVLKWEERSKDLVAIYANVHVARKSQKPIVVGKGGTTIRDIGRAAREQIERFIQRRVYLDLRVKVDENWFERAGSLRELGYNDR